MTDLFILLNRCEGIIAREGVIGLYRGFVPNALKSMPNSRYTFDKPVFVLFTSCFSNINILESSFVLFQY